MIRQPRILKVDESYTFARYAELPAERDEILADLGGTISSGHVTFPSYGGELHLEDLGDRLTDAFQFTTISSEQARREFLMAPIISFVCRHTQQKVRVEYPLNVSHWLKGTLDYYFQANNLLIIEAKRENLYTGFTQLAAELIALDQWVESDRPYLYGAVSTGQIWQFGLFERATKHLTEDLTLYRIPQELEILTRILIGILGDTALEGLSSE